MQPTIKIVPITAELYPIYYDMVQHTQWGNPMLPTAYHNKLWGDVLLVENQVIGGWVGTIRGDIPVARFITKSVYFDSYPIFANVSDEQKYIDDLIFAIKQHAKKERVVMINLTHWARGHRNIALDVYEKCATFIFDLSLNVEDLYAKLDRLKRRTIKKAEQAELVVNFYDGELAIPQIASFQQLRSITQQRAIQNNANASMLLKSDDFIINLMKNHKTVLANVIYNNQCVAAVTFIIGGQTVYAHMSGSDSEANKTTGAGTYYYWKAIEYFKKLGYTHFDFGGCPLNPTNDDPAYGIFMFKQGFGGDYHEFDGGQIIIAPRKYKLLQFLLSQRKLLRLLSKKL